MPKRKPYKIPLDEQILAARKAAKLTQAEVAELAGLDQSDVSKWEGGQNPSVGTLYALSRAVDDLFIVDGRGDSV